MPKPLLSKILPYALLLAAITESDHNSFNTLTFDTLKSPIRKTSLSKKQKKARAKAKRAKKIRKS